MIGEIDQWLSAFEKGTINRRELLTKLVLAAGAAVGVRQAEGAAGQPARAPTFPSRGLNHLALDVTDVARSRDWYSKHLGLKVLREGTNNCFLSTGDDFLALFKSSTPGMNHFCFTWPGKTADEAVRRIEAAGMKARREENRVYFKDPDGLTVQVAEENDWQDWGS
ncbi:MAG: VOC family protein [Planctomycetota bacterium]|jgi:catechol-2,3-dioxygenase